MAITNPVDLGFAEFVSALLSETLGAVVASITEQQENRLSLFEAANSDVETFASSGVADVEVEVVVARLFGDEASGTTLSAGSPVPADDVLASIDVDLGTADVSSGSLTQSGVDAIRSAIRMRLAERRLAALRDVAEEGIPRVLVDEGRIVVKLVLRALEVDDDDSGDGGNGGAATGPAAPVRVASPRLASFLSGPAGLSTSLPGQLGANARFNLASAIPAAIRNVRLSVRPVTEEATTDLNGEVEIRFRTVY
jgi:hypothetical protein